MFYAVYDSTTGQLQSVGTVVANPLPPGLSSVAVGAAAPNGVWNVTTHVFDAATFVAPLIPQDFMARFTMAEETAIRTRAMTDANMVTFLARVERARTVSLTHPDTIAGMDYCVSLALITAARKTVILNG